MNGKVIVVTGGRGFVGSRLVEFLTQKNPKKIISLDVKPLNDEKHQNTQEVIGDFTNFDFILNLLEGVDIVFHVGGLVGPYYPEKLYKKVNVEGTENIIKACQLNKIRILIFCSSPSTRFKGPNCQEILGLQEKDLDYPKVYTHIYSETKAEAERLVLQANSNELMTCALAPHQVYGPGDQLFLPSVLKSAESGRLRVIGNGKNLCSYTFVDNICYALTLAGEKIQSQSSIRGQFFIITDGARTNMWSTLNDAVVRCGYEPFNNKIKVPVSLALIIAQILEWIGKIANRQISVFNPYAVRMMTINRYFEISKSEELLGYQPLVPSERAWELTCQQFVESREQEKLQNLREGKVQPTIYDNLFFQMLYILILTYICLFQWESVNLLRNPKLWGFYDFLLFSVIIMIAGILLDYLLLFQYNWALQNKKLIKVYNNHKELDTCSKIYIMINRIQAIMVIYCLIDFSYNNPDVKWSLKELDFVNTVIALPFYFIIYDFMYYFFHRALHHPLIYKFIHKHHHRLYVPIRGNIDGINTHPLEYVIGAYMHQFSIWIFGHNHFITIILFISLGGYFSSINHTRIKFQLFGIYSVIDHDNHHNKIVFNYCQYCKIWDYLFNTRFTEVADSKTQIK